MKVYLSYPKNEFLTHLNLIITLKMNNFRSSVTTNGLSKNLKFSFIKYIYIIAQKILNVKAIILFFLTLHNIIIV